MKHAQRGVSLLLVGVMLILIIGSILAFLALFGRTHGAASAADTMTRLARAQDALEQFASASGRLPCPANPNPADLTTEGSEDGGGGVAGICGSMQGTLPWKAIGLRKDDGLDAWGWKISYRVYVGTTGNGLTRDNGANMTQCDTATSYSPGLDANKNCQQQGGWHTKDFEFLASKGLRVNDFGTPHSDIAYVLVSHGPSGRGAYTSTGGQPGPPVSADESSNTGDGLTNTFVAKAASSAGIPVEDVNHFDDVLAYRTLQDFVTRSHLAARDWTDGSALANTVNVAATTANVSAAVGSAVTPGQSLGAQVTFTNGSTTATVTAQAGGTAENLTFDTNAGVQGIGAGGTATTLSSADLEVLHVAFSAPAQSLALTLSGLGCRMTNGVCTDSDVVQLTFYDASDMQIGTTVTKVGCNTQNIASFTNIGTSTGVDFSSVDIAPKASTPGNNVTAFLVGAFLSCPDGWTCYTPLDTGAGPGGNHCP